MITLFSSAAQQWERDGTQEEQQGGETVGTLSPPWRGNEEELCMGSQGIHSIADDLIGGAAVGASWAEAPCWQQEHEKKGQEAFLYQSNGLSNDVLGWEKVEFVPW